VSAVAEEFAMIEVPCSQCGAKLQAEDEWVGKQVKCPDCGAQVLVDRPVGGAITVPPRPSAGESEAATLPPTASPPPAQTRGHGKKASSRCKTVVDNHVASV
jgi:DNA-directed RNA polymerase subunit RPC12/RpoP